MSPGSVCKSRWEADALMSDLTFIAGLKTGYFDSSVFGRSPIVEQLNIDLSYGLTPNISQQYFPKLVVNQATLHDNWLSTQLSPTSYNYLSI